MSIFLIYFLPYLYVFRIFVPSKRSSLLEGNNISTKMDATGNVFNFPLGAIVLTSVFGQEAIEAVIDLRWMLLAIIILMIIDTAYSYAEHVKDEHEGKQVAQWSTSGALRRFGGKIGTYLSFLIIGCVIGLAFTEPLGYATHVTTSAWGASYGLVCEILSIGGHVLHLRNIYIQLSPTKLIRSLIISYVSDKSDIVGRTLEKELKIEKKNGNNKERKPRRSRKKVTGTPVDE